MAVPVTLSESPPLWVLVSSCIKQEDWMRCPQRPLLKSNEMIEKV